MESMQIEKSPSLEININIYEVHGIRITQEEIRRKKSEEEIQRVYYNEHKM